MAIIFLQTWKRGTADWDDNGCATPNRGVQKLSPNNVFSIVLVIPIISIVSLEAFDHVLLVRIQDQHGGGGVKLFSKRIFTSFHGIFISRLRST